MIHIAPSSLSQITKIFDSRKSSVGLSGYSLGELLDHGGMSNVYRIVDGSGKTRYVLRISEEHKSSYSNNIFNVREMEILQELKKNRQPHVVQYLDAFVVEIPGKPRYYCSVMKFLFTLSQYHVKDDGEEIAVRLGCDLLPLLQSFSDRRILHRDIKPENIFYDKDFRNKTGFLLGDFGIAKRASEASVTPTGPESTMAPETRGLDRSLGNEKFCSDMYSLGMVMYRYLNEGVYPSNHERIDKMPPDTKPFPEPRYGSRRLKALVLRATSYRPDDRFESPQDMLRELQKCDEYRKYILHEPGEIDATVDASRFIAEENERLRLQRQQQQTPISASAKSPSSFNLNQIAIPALVCLLIVVVFSAITIISLHSVSGDSTDASADQDNTSARTENSSRPFDIDYDTGDSDEQTQEASDKSSENELQYLEVGDIVTLGKYPQGADGEIQPVAWRVLDIKSGRALLLSEELLDYVPYNDTLANVTWETCSLRSWLNKSFLNIAFSQSEQNRIAAVRLANPYNDEFGIDGGNTTTDRIFVLSIDEAEYYFTTNRDRIAYSTSYTHSHGKDSNSSSDWWILRSPGSKTNRAASVSDKGKIDKDGNDVNHAGIAVRPALWLILQ